MFDLIGKIGKVELISTITTVVFECWNVSDKYTCNNAGNLKQLSMDQTLDHSQTFFPADWKLACVAPILKNGSELELGNYRPISMLSTVPRVFERSVYEQLPEYFQENNFLTKYQLSFRKFHIDIMSMLKTTNK